MNWYRALLAVLLCPGSVRDSRGTVVGFQRSEYLMFFKRNGNAKNWANLRADLAQKTDMWWSIILTVFIIGIAATALQFARDLLLESSSVRGAVVLVMGLLASSVMIGLLRPPLESHIISVMLRHRRCAACTHDLSFAHTDEHGHAICAECGAHWLANPSQSTS